MKARGALAGVSEVQIFGDIGDDVLDVHSGKGEVDGGLNTDELILSGDKTDFDYTIIGGDMGVRIDDTAMGGLTGLNVFAVELFRFDDGLFLFSDLFGP